MRKLLIPIAFCILIACNSSKENKIEEPVKAAQADTLAITETVDTAKIDGVTCATKPNRVSFNGTLVIPPQYFATVTLTMGGIVKNTTLLPGAFVKKGTLLATLENPEFITLQQNYLDAHAQSEYLHAEFTRQQTLAREEVASQKKLQQTKADYHSMKSRMQAAAAQLSLLGVTTEQIHKNGIVSHLEVKAPISGYVNKLNMNHGKHIDAGETLCEVVDKNQMLLCLTAYEKDLVYIHAGNEVEFRVNGIGQKTFQAKVISIGQEVDEVSRSLKVYARVNNPEQLFRPGMYITAQIKRDNQD